MFGGLDQPAATKSAALIGGLTVLALAAMASAIPPARLVPEVTGVERGYLVSGAGFSDVLAELLNGDGYTYMAIDLTKAPLSDGSIWRAQFDGASRIFPVWGWVDVRDGTEQARKAAASLPLAGLYLYGGKPEDADFVRAAKPGLKVLRVVRGVEKGDAVLLALDQFGADAEGRLPVLLADRVGAGAVATARAKATGNYLVCSIPILE
jgi:hypothetical protein